jgi:AcrR family transcriptional regulator
VRGLPHGRAARRLRADAERNRERILLAARDVFVEQGPEAPLDEVARRAGVGIATLYRRFPERQALMRAVVGDVLARSVHEARRARAEETDRFAALARYMHAALDIRIAAVIPALLERVAFDDAELRSLSDTSAALVQALIDAAHADRTLRPDVTFGDIGLLIIRLSRPLPGGFPRELDANLAHRHLDVVLDGLRTSGDPVAEVLSGPALSLADLRSLGPADSTPHTGKELHHDQAE